MHYQINRPQAKLVQVLSGEVYDVAVDIRKDSPTFKKWFGVVLSGESRLQMYIPEGFAHGFYVISANAEFHYKCSDFYSPQDERGIHWNDSEVGIPWPKGARIVNPRDEAFPHIKDAGNDLPSMKGH